MMDKIDNKGQSALNPSTKIPKFPGNGGIAVGGNSGAVISPAPGLGLSAYQNPKKAK
jgi:hypothetical protein